MFLLNELSCTRTSSIVDQCFKCPFSSNFRNMNFSPTFNRITADRLTAVCGKWIRANIHFQGFIQALFLTSVFAFKIEFLWSMVIEWRAFACWKWSWESKRGAFTVVLSEHAQTAPSWFVFRVDYIFFPF